MMAEAWKKQFHRHLAGLDDRGFFHARYSFALAEVRAGLKPANLLYVPSCLRDMAGHWLREGTAVAASMGLETCLLGRARGGLLVLTWDPDLLDAGLGQEGVADFLGARGFCGRSRDAVVQAFRDRCRHGDCPHEIGVLLGYGLDNVRTFLENPEAPCLLCRYWRVYHQEERARELFCLIDHVREAAAIRLMAEGA